MSPQDLGVLLRQLWLYTSLAPLRRQLVQMAFVLLCSSFTGTRPRILVPPNSIITTSEESEELKAGQEAGQEPESSERRRKTRDDFQSDIPQYIRYDDLRKTLCYRDIDLFVIRNPDGGSDILSESQPEGRPSSSWSILPDIVHQLSSERIPETPKAFWTFL